MLNFWVDAVIGVAFVTLAVSGIVFLLPLGVRGVSAAGVATILFVSVPAWHAVHDWSAVTIVVGIGLHCALHYRWIVTMWRRAFSGLSAAPSAPQAVDQDAQRPRVGTAPAPVTMYRASGAASAARGPAPAESARTPSRRSETERRYTRGAFLTGAAGLAGGALLAGLIAARGQSPGTANQPGLAALSSGSGDSNTGGSSSSGSDGQQSDDYAYGYDDGSQQSGSSAAPGGGSTGAQVTVDAGACIGCGACLQVCPANVFAWSGGKAIAADPGACIRCGRCLQACPVSAITVTA
jgi:NAD-dependent dihydropyrimidine dehydrogenase PreA subunit